MIRIQADIKNAYVVRLENQQTEVSGYYLTAESAAEIGFEKITGLPDAIEETRFLEDAGEWSVYGLQWAYNNSEGFTRMYVRKIEPEPKEAKAVTSRRRFLAGLVAPICAAPVIAQDVPPRLPARERGELPARERRVITLPNGIQIEVTREGGNKLSIEKLNRYDDAVTVWLSFTE